MASLQSTTVNGILTVNLSSGTMISSSAMTDMIGWNASYGSYIGSTVGSTTYIYGNGSFYDGSANRTLLHSANVGTYAFPRSGSWAADLVSSYGFTREHGIQMTGGSEFVVLSKSGQGYLLVDGSYYAAEAGGFYSTNNSSGGTLLGFYADTTTSLNFNTATVKLNSNQILHAGNYGGYSTFTGSVTSGYGSFSSPGHIVGDAQYGLYVTGGNLYYKSASGGVHYWRNTANSGNPMALDNNGNLTITGALSEGGYTAYPDRVYTINLSAQSTAVFYPVVLDASPGEGAIGVWHHRFSVEMPSQGGGVNFNNHTLVAEVRGQGWSDQQLFYRAFHTYYDGSERSILGIWRGTQSWYGVVVYLRGGQTYYVRTNSRSVTGYTSAVTLNSNATFALKDYTNADVSGTSANISEMLNLFNTAAGFYHSNIITAPSMYAARFYDNDNSNYYLDPASTSNLNGLTVAGTITGSITGNAGTVTVTAGATNGAWYPIVWHDGNTLKSTSNVRIWAQNGYIESAYLQTTDDVSTSNISHIVAKFGDNYHRSATAAKVAGFISGQNMNISGTATNITAYTINQNVGTSDSPTFATISATLASSVTATTQVKTDSSTKVATTAFAKGLFSTPTTSGTLDWNDSSNTIPGAGSTLLLGNATNGFGVGDYYHPVNFEYNGTSGSGNVTQLAISYGTPGNDLRMRGRYNGTWSSWVRFWNNGNDGSGSGLDADLLDGVSWGNVNTSINVSSGNSQPLQLTTSSGSPWAIALVRSDIGLTSRVFAHNSPYNCWYFEHNISIAGNTNWHSGNDGAGSGLDADLLDGQHGSYYQDPYNFTLPTSWRVPIQTGNSVFPFLYGTFGDALAFKTISNLQYWDGSAWQTYSNTGIQNILTGNIQGSTATVTPTNKKFRFEFTADAAYLGGGVLVVHQTWNNGAHQVSSMLEYYNGTSWVTIITEKTSAGGESDYHFYNRGDIHGNWTQYRITITGADTVNNASYVGIQLLYDYTRAGLPNNFLPITWDYAKNVTTTGSFRAPIFYDSSNTNYYLDPASTSILNALTTGVIKGDSGSDYPHSFTNTDSGNTHWTNRNNRLLTSNGTNWATDGRDPIMALVTSGNSNATTIANSIGLALHNESSTDNTFSPAIVFSNRSNSTSYNTAYAAIIGRKTGQGVDSNWSAGELHFYTMPVGAYINNTPSLLINSSGDVTAARYLVGTYVNTSDNVPTSENITYVMAKFGDNYHRSASAAKVAGFISGQSMNINGSSTSCTGNAATVTNGVYTNIDNVVSGTIRIDNISNSFVNTVATANRSLTIYQNTVNADAYMTFHIGSDYAGYFGLGGAENDLVWGGWSVGNNRYRILHSGNAAFAWNMNQNVRTTDTTTFAGVRAGDGSLSAPSYSFSSDTNTGMYLYGADILGMSAGGVLGFAMSSSSMSTILPYLFVGGMTAWNTTTPGTTKGFLHLGDASSTANSGVGITWGARDSSSGTTAQAGIYVVTDGSYGTKMYFATTNNYGTGAQMAMRIEHTGDVVFSRGNVGVGTSPAYKLDVNGTVHYTTLTASSDVRFKKNVQVINNPLEKLSSIRGVRFEWNEFVNSRRDGYELNKPTFGVIAQELENVFPELVSHWKLSDDCPDARSVNYEKLIPVLIEAIKELNNKNSLLEARILALENKQ